MPIRTPVVVEIDRKTWLVQEYGLDCCYALLGERSGLLIDTGCGRMNIKALAARLFEGRPYQVVLTHGHSHHAGGAGCFEKVFCADTVQNAVRDEALSPDFIAPAYEGEDFLPECLPLYTGDEFDLGGRVVVCVRTPGHTAGSCSFYDRQSGIAFVGDACGRELKANNAVSDMLTGLMNLKRMAPGLDRLYPGHISYTDYRGMPASVLEDAICACRAALAPDGHRYHVDGKVVFRGVSLEYTKKWADMEPCSPYPPGI
ncbi:MAG: MBL fold metallo-hydrolase [Ruminococcaceae bacterium]|nr:MBL fold metallo-hydrolase [Oscillospiraceae bacterium]